jgi:hypothetical protein
MRVTELGHHGNLNGGKVDPMGRFATTAIIALALAGAAVESHAEDRAGTAPAKGASVSVEQLLADAAPAPAPAPAPAEVAAPGAPPPDGPMGMMRRPPGPDAMGWAGSPNMRPERPGAMWRMHEMEQTWGLFFNQRDKNLSNSDVQILADAILLVHGNHDWKVIDVADAADGQATFAYATADGSVIARFEIDRHSGRMMRIG